MASATYEQIVRDVARLSPDEQRQLRDGLNARVQEPPFGRGAALIDYLEGIPFDEAEQRDVELMAHAIEEGCERIERE